MSEEVKTPREVFEAALYDCLHHPGAYDREMAALGKRWKIAFSVLIVSVLSASLCLKFLSGGGYALAISLFGFLFATIIVRPSSNFKKSVAWREAKIEDMLVDYSVVENEIPAEKFACIYIEKMQREARQVHTEDVHRIRKKYGIDNEAV